MTVIANRSTKSKKPVVAKLKSRPFRTEERIFTKAYRTIFRSYPDEIGSAFHWAGVDSKRKAEPKKIKLRVHWSTAKLLRTMIIG